MQFGRKPQGEDNTALAVRATLRAFAGIFDLQDGEGPTYSRADIERLMLALVRVTILYWVDLTYGGVDAERLEAATGELKAAIALFDERRPNFYGQNIMGSDYAVGAREQNLDAGRRVLALASEIGGDPMPSPRDHHTKYLAPFETFSIFGPEGYTHRKRWADLLKASILSDRELLERIDVARLMLEPLWADPAGDAMETHLGEVHWALLAEQRWLGRELIAFIRERRGGRLVLGNPPEQMADRMRAIAALPNEFWEGRSAEDVCEGLHYCLSGDMENPHWGAVKPSMLRRLRERTEAYLREQEAQREEPNR
jgi:hypothetical protein